VKKKKRKRKVVVGIAVKGSLDSTPNSTVWLFSNPSAEDEGKQFVGKLTNVQTDANGHGSFAAVVPRGAATITAAATDPGGNTAEFSDARPVG
jgi:hypothetical protein